MKLRTLSITSTASIAAVSVLVATSLTLGTSYIDRQASALSASVERVRAIEELEISLLLHNRESLLFELGRGEVHALAREAAERDLQHWQAALRRSSTSTRSDELLRTAGLQIKVYLRERQRAEEAGQMATRAFASATDELEVAFRTLEQLLEIELAAADAARGRAEILNQAADVVSVAAVLVLVGMSLVILWLIRQQVYAPLLAVGAAIRRYGRGDQEARAEPAGVDELREIATVFNEMADALVQQRRQQLGVLASVAHDLRNPLAALKLSAASVRPDRPLPPEDRLRQLLARIGQQVGRCDRMLGDLLDMARLEGGKLELCWERRDARDLTREVVELYRPTAPSHEITLSAPDEPAIVRCDPLRLEQVLNNLVANAIKYSPAGGAVRVAVSCAGDEVSIAVSDEGVGIAAEDQGKLFQPYARAASSRDVAGGVGLGLWAARRLVEAHGGTISLASKPGAGATFTVRLPRAGEQGAGQGAEG